MNCICNAIYNFKNKIVASVFSFVLLFEMFWVTKIRKSKVHCWNEGH
jgi:hypothetical protein